jgi:uncharacterized membrane protein
MQKSTLTELSKTANTAKEIEFALARQCYRGLKLIIGWYFDIFLGDRRGNPDQNTVPFLFTNLCFMDTKKFLTGTLIGGIAFFFVGYLIYGMALADFFTAHTTSSAGAMRTMADIVWWALILGNVASGALLSYIFLKWAHISSFGSGASAGATIGFFMCLSTYLIQFATSNNLDLTGSLVDVVAGTVLSSISGGVIGAVLGMFHKN